jgi:hypothetical protein
MVAKHREEIMETPAFFLSHRFPKGRRISRRGRCAADMLIVRT